MRLAPLASPPPAAALAAAAATAAYAVSEAGTLGGAATAEGVSPKAWPGTGGSFAATPPPPLDPLLGNIQKLDAKLIKNTLGERLTLRPICLGLKMVPLAAGRTVVLGRDPAAVDVPLDSAEHPKMVSKRHCELTVGATFCLVRDLGSTNGTFVNDRPVSTSDAAHVGLGDVLTLGRLVESSSRGAYASDVRYQLVMLRQDECADRVAAAIPALYKSSILNNY